MPTPGRRSFCLWRYNSIFSSAIPSFSSFYAVLYAVGIVELELESTSALILLLFVIPLAFTLSGFLLWIMYALNGSPFPLVTNNFVV